MTAEPLRAQVVNYAPLPNHVTSITPAARSSSAQDLLPLNSPKPLEIPTPAIQTPTEKSHPSPPLTSPNTSEDSHQHFSSPPKTDACRSSLRNPPEFPGWIPEGIEVKRYYVDGSTVFSSKDLDEKTAPFTTPLNTHRLISIGELFQAADAVTKLYVDKGYTTSGAFIPLQEIKEGIVCIKVKEGELEEIQVTGAPRLKNYVRSRLAIAASKPLNQERLLKALQLLQLDPLIKNISADLSAGSRSGTNILKVHVNQNQSFRPQLILDNNRSPSVGSFERQIKLTEANLLGLGDEIVAAYTNTDGSNAENVSYSLPLNPRNGTLSFSYTNVSNNVIEPPFDALNLNASLRYYDLTLRQPIFQTPEQELALGLTASRRESEASLLGGEIPFPVLGADTKGRTRVSALRFFQEFTLRCKNQTLAFRSQFSLGLNAFNATINSNPPDGRFFDWQGQASWFLRLAPDTFLKVRGDVQLADRALVPLEQFGLGGQDSVRGYRQDFLLTDSGAFASVELQVPILRIPQANGILHLAPFVDFGTGSNQSDIANPNPNTLASVGLGLRLQAKYVEARFDWGIPFVSANSSKRTLQENGLYFSLIWNSF